MPLFQVLQGDGHGKTNRQLVEMQPVQFASEGWFERRDLQALLRDNPKAIDPNLMVISEEFEEWDESKRRIDLLGLDKQGKLVVIELKVVEGGDHMELQALRYAAMVSTMNFDQVVSTYAALQRKPPEEARKEVLNFLNTQDPVIKTPRVVLVAPNFSKEITTTVLWLNERGLDVRCVKANLYKLGEDRYLNLEEVIPLPSASDYMMKIREKQKTEERTTAELLHLEFWTQFGKYLEDRRSPIHMGKPSTTAMGNVSLGRSLFRLIPWNVVRDAHSGIWVRFIGTDVNTIYEKIPQDYRHLVEEKLSPLGEWVWLPQDAQGVVLSLRRRSTLSKRESWQELNGWMAQALETTYELFTKIVTSLNAEGFVLDAPSDADGELTKEASGLTSNE
ncbi:MAG: DUF4268 domain-containing protein [Candidatus Binatia bacterium]